MNCILGFIDRSLRYGVSHEVRFKILIQLLSLGMRDTLLSQGVLQFVVLVFEVILLDVYCYTTALVPQTWTADGVPTYSVSSLAEP